MELIIKPTSACNFKCSFCSAANLTIPTLTSVSAKLNHIIHKLTPSTIIFTGGEPTLCPPSFYKELLELTEDMNPQPIISLTTNMMEIALENPEKWIPVLKDNPRIQITASFNYGNTRKLASGKVFDEGYFKTAMEAFRRYYNYTPTFIAVIDDSNEYTIQQHLDLAKELNTTCKINAANALGRQCQGYPRYKIFSHYADIIESGQDKYEQNCRDRKTGSCPFNTTGLCQNTIRAIYLTKEEDVIWTTCEPELELGLGRKLTPENEDEFYGKKAIDTNIPIEDLVMGEQCLYCSLKNLCNNCGINRAAAKEDHTYCLFMQDVKPFIEKEKWKL